MTEIHLSPQGHFREAVLPRYRALAAAVLLSAIKDLKRFTDGKNIDDPTEFLTTDTIWHQLLDLDPAKVRRFIDTKDNIDTLYATLKANENKILNRGKSPGNINNMKAGWVSLKERSEISP